MSNPYVGEIRMFGGNFAPAGWAFCDGSLLAIAEKGRIEDMIPLLRPAIIVRLDTPVLEMLRRFRTGRTQFALATEEGGRVVGFFTLFDVVQIIVGDIEDEHRSSLGDVPLRAADGTMTIPGSMPIYRLERRPERVLVFLHQVHRRCVRDRRNGGEQARKDRQVEKRGEIGRAHV